MVTKLARYWTDDKALTRMAEPHEHHVTKDGVRHLMKTLKKEQKDLEHELKEKLSNPNPTAEDMALYKQLKKRHTEVRHKKHEAQKALNMLAEQGPGDMQHADFVQELKDPHAWETDDEHTGNGAAPAGGDGEKSRGDGGSKRCGKRSGDQSKKGESHHGESGEGQSHESRSKRHAEAEKRVPAAEEAQQPGAAAALAAAPAAAALAAAPAAEDHAEVGTDGKLAAQRRAEAKLRAEAEAKKQEEEEFRKLHPGAHAAGGASKVAQPMEMERPDEARKHLQEEEMNYAKQHPVRTHAARAPSAPPACRQPVTTAASGLNAFSHSLFRCRAAAGLLHRRSALHHGRVGGDEERLLRLRVPLSLQAGEGSGEDMGHAIAPIAGQLAGRQRTVPTEAAGLSIAQQLRSMWISGQRSQ